MRQKPNAKGGRLVHLIFQRAFADGELEAPPRGVKGLAAAATPLVSAVSAR